MPCSRWRHQDPVARIADEVDLTAVLALASLLLPGPPLSVALSWLPLGLFFLYGLSVVIEGRKDGIKPVTIFWAPVYLVWRCSAFIMAWSFFDRIKLPARDTK